MEELTLQQYKALCYLVAGYSNEEIAEKTAVTTRTITNWKKLPTFQTELRNAVAKVYEAAIAELVLGSQEAAKELRRIITDSEVADRIKIQAIQALLTHANKAKEWHLEDRLERLEGLLDGNTHSQ